MTEPLRAPAEDDRVLCVPPWPDVPAVAEANAARAAEYPPELGCIRSRARSLVRAAARDYLASLGEPVPGDAGGRLLAVAGHQPEMFHPGVWVKNAALAGLARMFRTPALNLIVDSDTLKTPTLLVPAADESRPRLATVPFDRGASETPWEERLVADPAVFASFGDAVKQLLSPWNPSPLIDALWPRVVARLAASDYAMPVGEVFAAVRREQERAWGVHNLEVPVSAVCAAPAFADFAGLILAHAGVFAETYNAVVRGYRKARRIRSRNHPVPDLAASADRVEVPLWAWRAGQRRRGRVFVRLVDGRCRLWCGDDEWPSLPAPPSPDFAAAWADLLSRGYKLRSRALVTTMFARLCLADVFLHGIGGGVYDALTDAILTRFFRVPPPAFAVVTATLRLSLPTSSASEADRRAAARLVRDLEYNPDRYADGDSPGVAALLARKAELRATPTTTSALRKVRYREIRAVNAALAPFVAHRRAAAEADLARVTADLAADAVLRRRDFSLLLHDESRLRALFARFA